MLSTLHHLGGDATVRLDKPDQDLIEAFVHEADDPGFGVIIDYLWGRPPEAFLAALTRTVFAAVTSETRLVEVGETAGPTISLPSWQWGKKAQSGLHSVDSGHAGCCPSCLTECANAAIEQVNRAVSCYYPPRLRGNRRCLT